MREFYQSGRGKGKNVFFVGESPSPKGWHEGKACLSKNGTLLPTGKRLDDLLMQFSLSINDCGFAELCQKVLKDRKSMRKEAKRGWDTFLEHVNASSPKLLIILGVETTRVFSELSGVVCSIGKISSIKLGRKTYYALPIYHPSPINPKGAKRNKAIFTEQKKTFNDLLK